MVSHPYRNMLVAIGKLIPYPNAESTVGASTWVAASAPNNSEMARNAIDAR